MTWIAPSKFYGFTPRKGLRSEYEKLLRNLVQRLPTLFARCFLFHVSIELLRGSFFILYSMICYGYDRTGTDKKPCCGYKGTVCDLHVIERRQLKFVHCGKEVAQ